MSDLVIPWLGNLLWQTLCLSAVIGGILLLRPWCLRSLGARAAHGLWIGVPLSLVALALPVSPAVAELQPATLLKLNAAVFATWHTPQDAPHALSPFGVGNDLRTGLALAVLALWATGFLLGARSMWLAHREMLAPLRWHQGAWRSPAGTGPALVGFLRPRVCLPADFELRFSPEEQRLILAHEAVHQRRHDNLFNFLASMVCWVHWFNPCVWMALRRWRADQELSCDAEVLCQAPSNDVPVYARALAKAQDLTSLSSRGPSLVCTWQAQHPLLERITMLKQHRDQSPRLRRTAIVFSLMWGLLSAATVHAVTAVTAGANPTRAQPPVVQGQHFVEMDVDLQVNGALKRQVRVTTMRGNPQWIFSEKRADNVPDPVAGQPWAVQVNATPVSDDSFRLDLVVMRLDPQLPPRQALQQVAGGRVVAKPVLVTRADLKARVEITDEVSHESFQLDLVPRWTLKATGSLSAVDDRG